MSNVINLYGKISNALEEYLRSINGTTEKFADSIRGGSFAEIMCDIVEKTDIEQEEKEEFISDCSKYHGIMMREIGEDECKRLFEEFCKLTGCSNVY